MLQLQMRGGELSGLVSPESQEKSKDGRCRLPGTVPGEMRLSKKHLEVNECPADSKQTYQGTAPRQSSLGGTCLWQDAARSWGPGMDRMVRSSTSQVT